MAILIGGNAGISVDSLSLTDLLLGVTVIATGTQFTLKDGDYLEEFQGQFTYDAAGLLSGGSVTAWRETLKGEVVFDVSGFSVPVQTFLTWVNNNDNEAARSTILGGADRITTSNAADTLRGYAGDDTISDSGGRNYLRGDEGNDSISGGSGFDDINGNMGNDTCIGGLGDDWVVGGRDNDSLVGGSGANLVYGNLGNDTCEGGAGDDIVRGGQNNDMISGGAGNDYVSGDKGDDTVTGGTGADIFHTFGDAAVDRVLDFNRAEGDRVQLDPGTQFTVSQVGADTFINMTGGGQMVLVGVSMSSLIDGWIFGA